MQQPTPKRKLIWVVSAVAGALVFLAALIWGPWLLEKQHVRDSGLAPSAGIIVTGFRTMLVAVAAGGIAALGLHYTHKNHQLAHDQFRQTQEQFRLAQEQFAHAQEQFRHTQVKDRESAEMTREGQVTDRYVEAIELLGSENVTKRLGGIYSLERIMKDSEKDHQTVVEVLASFIRHAEEQKDDVDRPGDEPAAIPPDVEAAFVVLGRRPERTEAFRTNLRISDLSGVTLDDANLYRADLQGVRMPDAKLRSANLHRANLGGANLSRADLREANLHDAEAHAVVMRGADLRGANLHQTLFEEADLQDVDLRDSNLHNAVLRGAALEEADLRTANLHGAELIRAKLKKADLREANLSASNLSDADLHEADLGDANLFESDLRTSRNLTAEQLVRACLYHSTLLPDHLAQLTPVQERIEQCEAERAGRN